MFVEFGKNILGNAAQALALTKGLSKLGETSKSVGEIKQGQSTQILEARKSYETAQKNLNETRDMYKLTQENIAKQRQMILHMVGKKDGDELTLSDIISVSNQARANQGKMKEGGK